MVDLRLGMPDHRDVAAFRPYAPLVRSFYATAPAFTCTASLPRHSDQIGKPAAQMTTTAFFGTNLSTISVPDVVTPLLAEIIDSRRRYR